MQKPSLKEIEQFIRQIPVGEAQQLCGVPVFRLRPELWGVQNQVCEMGEPDAIMAISNRIAEKVA